MEWNTGGIFGMEQNGILKIWNTIRIFGKYSGILFEYQKNRIYSEILGKMVFEQYSGIFKYCQAKKHKQQNNCYFFGLYFKNYHKFALCTKEKDYLKCSTPLKIQKVKRFPYSWIFANINKLTQRVGTILLRKVKLQ